MSLFIFDSLDDAVCCETCAHYLVNGGISYCDVDGHYVGFVGAVCDCCGAWKKKEAEEKCS